MPTRTSLAGEQDRKDDASSRFWREAPRMNPCLQNEDTLWCHANPWRMVSRLSRHGDLIRQFLGRAVQQRYKGSYLGLLWSFLNPVLLLAIYTFVFGVVFKARWPAAKNDGLLDFALISFCGIVVFNVFSECVASAPTLIIGNVNYVKKVVFPLEILPIASLGASVFHGLVSTGILILALAIAKGSVHMSVLLIPVIVAPLLLLTLGVSWILAALGVFFRDIQQIVAMVLTAAFFLTPIFYSIDSIPIRLQPMVRLNPLGLIVEDFRRVVFWGQMPEWKCFVFSLLFASLILCLGYGFFMRLRGAFADVM